MGTWVNLSWRIADMIAGKQSKVKGKNGLMENSDKARTTIKKFLIS